MSNFISIDEARNNIRDLIKELFTTLIFIGIKDMPDSWAKGISNKERHLACNKILDEAFIMAENGSTENDGIKKQITAFGKALQENPNLSVEEYLAKTKSKKTPTFSVSVAVYKESHQTTYHVYLQNKEMVEENESPLDEHGKIIAHSTPHLEHANIEGEVWAEFLGVPFTPLTEITNQKENRG